MWDPYAEFESATLSNGLTIHAAHWADRPWEVLGFLVHSGAEQDPVGLEGVAHFVEHLVLENARVPKKDICAFFANSGGSVKLGTTDYAGTSYRFWVPADKNFLTRALALFGHMLLLARLERFVEREREVIIGEFRQHFQHQFMYDLAARRRQALHTGDFLARFVRPLGTAESIRRISQLDLQLYYDAHYTPANMSVVGVGGISLADLVDLLSLSPFGVEKQGARTPFPVPVADVDSPTETRHVFRVSEQLRTESPFEVGAYGTCAKIPGDANPQALRVLADMLDEMLEEEVREKRAWTYHIDSSCSRYRYFSEFSIECDALSTKALDEIEEVIDGCIDALRSSEDLFARARSCALASTSMIDVTGKGVCEDALDDLTYRQRIISLAEVTHDLASVTMNDIRELLRWLRPERRWTLITRP